VIVLVNTATLRTAADVFDRLETPPPNLLCRSSAQKDPPASCVLIDPISGIPGTLCGTGGPGGLRAVA
jgi:hypothetical protein